MEAITRRYPNALIQFEVCCLIIILTCAGLSDTQDFRNPYAEMLLKRYRNTYRMFNDDIQGTGLLLLLK